MASNGPLLRSSGITIIMFLVMAFFHVTQAQMAPSPAPSNDSASLDQGIAYILMLVALAVTYLLH